MKTIEEIVSETSKKIGRNLNLIVDSLSQNDDAQGSEKVSEHSRGYGDRPRIVCGTVITSDPDHGVELSLHDGNIGWIPPCNLEGRAPDSRIQLTSSFYPGRFLKLQVDGVDEETGRLVLRRISRFRLARQKNHARNRYRKVASERVTLDSFKYIAVDAANVIGLVNTDELRQTILKALDKKIRELGKTPIFFVETSVLSWLRKYHKSAYRPVQEFANDTSKCVLCVSRNECDCELIAFLESHKDAIGISCDGYKDYGVSFDVGCRIHGATIIASIPGLPPTLQLSWLGESIELA